MQVFHLLVALECQEEGIMKAVVRADLQFHWDQGTCAWNLELVLDTNIVLLTAMVLVWAWAPRDRPVLHLSGHKDSAYLYNAFNVLSPFYSENH